MKPTTKTLLATLLLFFITTGIMAQEKYEYATLKFEVIGTGKYSISISTDNNEFKEIIGEFASSDRKISNIVNTAPALKWIKENSWDIVEFHPSGGGRSSNDFLLRKKTQ